MGQVYAYLYGEFGVRVKLFGIKKSFKILEAGVAALLRGQFPNPTYFEGYVGAYYSVMGGLVSGNMRLHVEYGDKCIIERSADDGLEVPIISDIDPENKDKDIDVFTSPQVTFNYAIDKPVRIQESDGEKTYRIKLEQATMTSDGKELPITLEWNDAKDAVTYALKDEILPSEKNILVTAKVVFEQRINSSWVAVKRGGRQVNETKKITFKTSKAPDYIPWKNIAYLYPLKDQKNFYPKEYNKGYVQLKLNQGYLIEGWTPKAQLVNENGLLKRVDFNYDASKKVLHFDLPDMDNSSNYKLDIMVFPKGTNIPDEEKIEVVDLLSDKDDNNDNWFANKKGGEAALEKSSANLKSKKATRTVGKGKPKSILDFTFRVSKHNTFKEKINSLKSINDITEIISANVHFLEKEVDTYERFSNTEILGSNLTNNKKLIYVEVEPKDNYFKRKINPLVYNLKYDSTILKRNIVTFGRIPIKDIPATSWYQSYMINTPDSPFLNSRIPYQYSIVLRYKNDFLNLRNKVVNIYNSDSNISSYNKFHKIMNARFPALIPGKYYLKFQYSVPGGFYKSDFETLKFINE